MLRITGEWLIEIQNSIEEYSEVIEKIFIFYKNISFTTEMLDHSKIPKIIKLYYDMKNLPEPVVKKVFLVFMKNKQLFEDWIRDVDENRKILPDPTLKRKYHQQQQ